MVAGSSLCFPWLRSSKSSKKSIQHSVPSTAEYALEGVKISLDLLKEAAAFVPVPYVRPALETAIKLITIGEDVQVTIKRVDDLNKRVWALMLVMIQPLKGKSPEDIPKSMQKDVEQLTSDLQSIEAVLRRIATQNSLLLVIFKRLNEERVQDCLEQLDESLSKFQVSREINNALLMWEMATGIKAVYGLTEQSLKVTEKGLEVAKAGLDVASGTLGIAHKNHDLAKETLNIANQGLHIAHDGVGVAKESLKVTIRVADQVDEIHNVLKQRIHEASALPSREMPTKPRFFYGRDDVVDNVVRLLTTNEHPHVALLGAGGMGKTSVALAVMGHDAIMTKFGGRRFWVPCVEGRTPSRFLDILVSCLRITQDTGDQLSDILFELKASPDSRIILLDNFETCWNLDGHQAEIERILCALANIPHISLLITMRSNFPPSEEIEWHSQLIGSLDTREASRVYNSIQPDASSDPALDELLRELGHMPLAITLMAKLGKKSGSMPSSLLQTWREENVRTNMLDSGSDAMRSINVSISLSVHSIPMKAKPEAFTLLATLSMFPAGTQHKNLARWAPTILDLSGALAALTETSLADQRARSIYVLPVIRSYMLHPTRLPDTVKTHVREGVYRFMMEHKSEPGDPTFLNDAQELANEETNIQSVLMDAVKDGFNAAAVDALLAYCWYQYWTRPRLEIIETVLQIARTAKQEMAISESLFCLGHMCCKIDHHSEALEALLEARDLFRSFGNQLKAAQCLLKISELHAYLQDANACLVAVELARQELEQVGDADGIAEGLLRLGEFHWFNQDRSEALEILEQAREHYTRLNKPIGVAHCTYCMSRAHYGLDNHDEARIKAETAFTEYKRLDHRDRAAECLIHLCRVLKDMKCHAEARARTIEGIQLYRDIGGPSGIAQGLQVLGEVYTNMDEYDQARAAYEESIEVFRPILGTPIAEYGTALCLAGLSRVYGLLSRPNDAKKAWRRYEAMGVDVTLDRR